MSNQAEIDKALDDLEIDNEEVSEEVIEAPNEVTLAAFEEGDEEVVEEVEEIVAEKLPGYIDNVDDWVAAGKDPKLFKNPEMYKAEYKRIQEINDLKETMQTVVEGVGEWKEQQQEVMDNQIKQARTDAEAALETAKEDDDIDAALKAQNKINELDQPAKVTYKPNPVLTEFYSKNPILDKNSPQFDEEVFTDTSMYQAVELDKLTGGNRQMQLSPSQIERSLKLALNNAKALSPDKFVSPRNKRKAAPAPTKIKVKQSVGDYTSRLKGVKSDSMNRRDTSAASDVYDMIKAKAEKIQDPVLKAKALKSAETYAKTVLGD